MNRMRRIRSANFTLPGVLALIVSAIPAVHAELPPLIPRETLFGNPERVSPQISPDGKRFAWIAPNTKFDFNARAEAFLAQNLGARAEPVQGDKYPGSTAVVKVIGR